MKFKAKLRKIGNSLGVIIPLNVITGYKKGDFIELNVITEPNVITEKSANVITSEKPPKKKFNTEWCDKHNSMKGTCECK